MRIEIEKRGLRVLLALHAVLYTLFFVLSIGNLDYPMRHQTNFVILLVWTTVLVAHVAYHFARVEPPELQREAYREG